ncbi:hypothetical protein C0Q70_10618 [Pomacea canaliculata]|uniref:Uncharacterized protein n=1 Tax=Pomacea canaliculata TaxID=400727 RepID=A0A2T7P3N4_POMCA|nr:hypothetical protein C0Q70_10618 [Pomacea canaliculata]
MSSPSLPHPPQTSVRVSNSTGGIHKKQLNCRPGGALAVLLCHGGGSGGEAVGGDSFMTSTRVQPRGAEGGWGRATVSHSIMHTRPRVCEPSTLNSRLSTRAAPPLQSTRTSSSPLPPSHPPPPELSFFVRVACQQR